MRKAAYFILGSAFILLLAACRAGAVGTETGTQKEKPMIIEYTTYHSLAETENSYYLFPPMERLLYSVDKKTLGAAILCAREGCSHSDRECYAYADAGGPLSTVRIWDDGLYAIKREDAKEYLMRISADGSGYTPVYELPENGVYNFALADHYLVYYMIADAENDSDSTIRSRGVYAVSLDSGNPKEIYRCSETEEVERLLPFDRGVMIVTYSNSEGRERSNWYLPSTGRLVENIIVGDHHICYYEDGKIYYYVTSEDKMEISFYRANPDGSQPEYLFGRETEGKQLRLTLNGEYAFINDVNEGILSVCSLDGETAAEAALEDASSYFWYGMDREYLYCTYSTPRDPGGKRGRIEIDALLKGEFENTFLFD